MPVVTCIDYYKMTAQINSPIPPARGGRLEDNFSLLSNYCFTEFAAKGFYLVFILVFSETRKLNLNSLKPAGTVLTFTSDMKSQKHLVVSKPAKNLSQSPGNYKYLSVFPHDSG